MERKGSKLITYNVPAEPLAGTRVAMFDLDGTLLVYSSDILSSSLFLPFTTTL